MNIKTVLNEEKKKEKKKMLPELHALDDSIETFIQKLEVKINGVKDNPIFQRNAHQLLGDMSKEYSEFMFALRAIVNAVDRKGQVLPKEKPIGRIRDVNSKIKPPDEEGGEVPPEGEEGGGAVPPKGVKEALEMKTEKKLKRNKIINELLQERTIEKNKLFALGRQVQDELNKVMITMSLRPKATDFDKVAKVLGISKSNAIKAFNEFTWGE